MGFSALKAIGENWEDYAETKPLATLPASIAISKNYPNREKVINDLSTGYARALKSGALTKILENAFYGAGKVPDWVLKF
jgi:hypothetical protein